jgi:hypothetical protein
MYRNSTRTHYYYCYYYYVVVVVAGVECTVTEFRFQYVASTTGNGDNLQN